MNSYLNMHIRERYGFTYAIESAYTAYYDSGVFSVYASTDKRHTSKTIDLIKKELENMILKPFCNKSLSRFKNQLIGQLVVNADQNQTEMLAMGKTLLNFGKITPLKEVCRQVEQVSCSQIAEVAREVFAPERLSVIQYG